ncbi:hypothetical protein ACQJBY_011307 [Aegilops geniculata]
MVQLQNFFFFITSMVVPRGTAAPVLLKWFVSRDVPTGASSSNGTIIPIPIPLFPFLVYLHLRKFIRSMDRAKSGVLVKASRPILLPDKMERSSSARNALFRFVPVLHFLIIESMGDLSYLESFCGLLCLQFFRTLFSLPRDRSAKRERALRKSGLEALALPTSRLLMAVGHDYYKKVKMNLSISHGGVCIFMLGVLLSCDPMAYVRPVAHASYSICSGRAA